MFSQKACATLAVMCITVAAGAQQPAAKPLTNNAGYPMVQQLDKTVTYASAADVAAMIDKAKTAGKGDAPMVVGELLQLAPYTLTLEYHEKGKPLTDVGVHPKYAELNFVLDGSATLVTGGTRSADHMRIDGGESQKIGKGDFFLVPEGVPHWISHVDQTLVLVSVHMPRSVPAP